MTFDDLEFNTLAYLVLAQVNLDQMDQGWEGVLKIKNNIINSFY